MNSQNRITLKFCIASLCVFLNTFASGALFGPDAYLLLDDMHGLPRDAKVDWRGVEVGKLSRLGMEKGRHKVELSIEKQYLENMHTDIRFTIDETAKVIHLVGGAGTTYPALEKGAEILQSPSASSKAAAAGLRVVEDAKDGVSGFFKGLRGPIVPESPTKPSEPIENSVDWKEWMQGGIDFYLLGILEGVSKGAPIIWKGGVIGRVTGITTQDKIPKLEVRLLPGYRGQLHSDVRFVVAGGNPVGIRLVGGNDEATPLLAKGAIVPAQTASEAGERAGTAFRSWLQNGGDAAKELGRAINDKELIRAIEEEIQNQQKAGAPKEKTN
jgi:hypothetical protein